MRLYRDRGHWLVIERDKERVERIRKTPHHVGIGRAVEKGRKGYVLSAEYKNGYEIYAHKTLKAATAAMVEEAITGLCRS